MWFGPLARTYESADARIILTVVPRSDWKRPTGQDVLRPPGRCHRDGTGKATLEVIGSKWSNALNWCKPNNDDDDPALLATTQHCEVLKTLLTLLNIKLTGGIAELWDEHDRRVLPRTSVSSLWLHYEQRLINICYAPSLFICLQPRNSLNLF